jgi:beta-mannosidase
MPVSGQLTVEVWTSKAKVESLKLGVKVAANSATDVWQQPAAQLLAEAGVAADEAIVHAEFRPDNTTLKRTTGKPLASVYANNYILVYPKDLKLQPSHVQVKLIGIAPNSQLSARPWSLHTWRTSNIQLSTTHYARGIFLSLDGDDDYHFSDNYFDLLPGEERTVSVTTPLPADEVQRRLRVMVYR